jgi:hypothetical protein
MLHANENNAMLRETPHKGFLPNPFARLGDVAVEKSPAQSITLL